jgi:hypothetical protein
MNQFEFEEKVMEWSKTIGLYQLAGTNEYTLKLFEEIGELVGAILENRTGDIKEEIGDVCVVITQLKNKATEYQQEYDVNIIYDISFNLLEESLALLSEIRKNTKYIDVRVSCINIILNFIAKLIGCTLAECQEIAYNKIISRKGKLIGKTFVKQERIGNE